jgi:glucose-1-phosphate thymidylyltransferase
MKGIILAAGYATRLHPLTKNRSKCLIEINGRPIIDYIVRKMEKVAEIDRIYIVTNQKFVFDFEDYARQAESSKPVTVINDQTESNEDRLGAIGDIAYAIEEESIDDDLMVVAGDNLFEFTLTKFARFFTEKNAGCVAAHRFRKKSDIAGKFGVLETGEGSLVTGFEEKPDNPKTNLVATACYLFRKEDCAEISPYRKSGLSPENPGEFIKYLSSKKPVYAFIFSERWYDIGSFEDLGRARERFRG